jgi:hypothetical protein
MCDDILLFLNRPKHPACNGKLSAPKHPHLKQQTHLSNFRPNILKAAEHALLHNHSPRRTTIFPPKKKAEICPSHITPNPSLSTSLKTTSNQGAMPAEMSNHDPLSLPRLICTSESPEAGGRHDATRIDGPGERDTWGMEHDGNEPWCRVMQRR